MTNRPLLRPRPFSQLNNTKDVENRMTLLHYLAEVVERKHPELLSFMDEISHVERAAKVSYSHDVIETPGGWLYEVRRRV